MKIRASVIIPNWNGRDLLKDCLSSVVNQTYKHFEVVVVDNNSSDDSISFVENNFSAIRLIKLDQNYGFAKAINIGVKKSKAEYVIFLNNDTSVNANWLENLIKCADLHPEAVSVNSKILNFYHPKFIDGVGILINEVGQARSIGYNEKDKGRYQKEMYIFGATAGASLFKRKEFLKIGGFDENFFMYYEEVDFAFRAQFLGYKSVYCPSALVFHKHKATAKRTPSKIEYWQFKNMLQTIIKNYPKYSLIRKWRWLKIILVHLNTFFYLFRHRFFWPPILADIWILFHLPDLLKRRFAIQKNIRSEDLVESYLQEKKITFYGLLK